MLSTASGRKPATTIILVLSGHRAYWSRWQEGHLVVEYIEFIEELAASKQATRCPWLTGADARLHLIVDSALDVVDRVVAPDLPSGFIGSLQRTRLLRLLARENTDADLIKLPRAVTDVACLARNIWPQHWAPWLEQLQNGRIVFESIRSATQLWLTLLTRHTPSGLLVVAGALHHQHLWIEQACIRFSRIVAVDSSIAGAGLLDETLSHLVERLGADVLDAYVVGVPAHEIAVLSEHTAVRKVIDIPSVTGPMSNKTTSGAAMAAELPAGVITIERTFEHSLIVPRLLAACVAGRPLIRQSGYSRWPMMPVWAKRIASGFRKPTIRQRLQHHDARQLLKKRDHLDKLVLLRRTTRIVVSIASIAALIAISKGLVVFRQRTDQLSNQHELRQYILQHKETAQKLHSDPQGLNMSLVRAEYFYQVAGPGPVDILSLVSKAVDQSTAVELSRLSWRRVPEIALGSEAESTSVENAGFRQSLPDAMTRTDTLRLRLAGHIDDDLTLRQRQRKFEIFIEQLEQQMTVTEVLIQMSPATRVAGDFQTGHASPDFVVRVLVRAG